MKRHIERKKFHILFVLWRRNIEARRRYLYPSRTWMSYAASSWHIILFEEKLVFSTDKGEEGYENRVACKVIPVQWFDSSVAETVTAYLDDVRGGVVVLNWSVGSLSFSGCWEVLHLVWGWARRRGWWWRQVIEWWRREFDVFLEAVYTCEICNIDG